jgi:hypothetical protein
MTPPLLTISRQEGKKASSSATFSERTPHIIMEAASMLGDGSSSSIEPEDS